MSQFFDPSLEERHALEALAGEIPAVQQALVDHHVLLTMPDRGAHQQQLAGSKVLFTAADQLPQELDGLGIFTRSAPTGPHHVGIGRISTGLGCPHAETDPDFLGLMVAFRTKAGHRIDFVTINDPTAPTDTPEEFIALLKATADSAGTEGLIATQAKLLLSLTRHAGLRGPAIGLHVAQQTARTTLSTTAFQQYWSGVVRAREVLGKFTFVPLAQAPDPHPAGRGPRHLTKDWRARQRAGALEFRLFWIPFLNEHDTPLNNLTSAWRSEHEVLVGTVAFPQADPDALESKLVALLASELGANPGNWDEAVDQRPDLPATRFTAARALVYRASQMHRRALPEEAYQSFFEAGTIGPALGRELVRRYTQKQAARHWVPDLGDICVP